MWAFQVPHRVRLLCCISIILRNFTLLFSIHSDWIQLLYLHIIQKIYVNEFNKQYSKFSWVFADSLSFVPSQDFFDFHHLRVKLDAIMEWNLQLAQNNKPKSSFYVRKTSLIQYHSINFIQNNSKTRPTEWLFHEMGCTKWLLYETVRMTGRQQLCNNYAARGLYQYFWIQIWK